MAAVFSCCENTAFFLKPISHFTVLVKNKWTVGLLRSKSLPVLNLLYLSDSRALIYLIPLLLCTTLLLHFQICVGVSKVPFAFNLPECTWKLKFSSISAHLTALLKQELYCTMHLKPFPSHRSSF